MVLRIDTREYKSAIKVSVNHSLLNSLQELNLKRNDIIIDSIVDEEDLMEFAASVDLKYSLHEQEH